DFGPLLRGSGISLCPSEGHRVAPAPLTLGAQTRLSEGLRQRRVATVNYECALTQELPDENAYEFKKRPGSSRTCPVGDRCGQLHPGTGEKRLFGHGRCCTLRAPSRLVDYAGCSVAIQCSAGSARLEAGIVGPASLLPGG